MYEDKFGYNDQFPEEIREIFMWLCQDLVYLNLMWRFYEGLFDSEEKLAILTDAARGSFRIIEESLRSSLVMAICRLNDPASQRNNENLSIKRLTEYFQENEEIQSLCKEFEEACQPFEKHRNKVIAHRDLETTINRKENILPKIDKTQVDEVVDLLSRIVNIGAGNYVDSEYGFSGKVIGDADSLLLYLKKGLDSQKAELDNLKRLAGNNSKDDIFILLSKIKSLAKRYKELTGKPLGVTGEVAEVFAAHILKLELSEVRQPGYDATKVENDKTIKYQIKSRCIPKEKKGRGRLGAIKFTHEWDYALMVLLNEDLEVTKIYQADRKSVREALERIGSKARNERGQLSVSQFKAVSQEIWNQEKGLL